MSDEEPQQQSIQARIAALNLGQVGRAPVTANASKPPLDHRPCSVNVPVVSSQPGTIGNEPRGLGRGSVLPPPVITRTGQKPEPPPKLPPRKPSTPGGQLSLALPAHRPSDQLGRPSDQLSRRDSMESMSSVVSTTSSVFSSSMARTPTSRAPSIDMSRIKAPVYDPMSLPPLPPKRSKEEKDEELKRASIGRPKPKALATDMAQEAPSLPQRPAARDQPRESGRKLPPKDPPPMPARSLPPSIPALKSHSFSSGTGVASKPPPVPLASRPDLSRIMATKPKMSSGGVVAITPAATPEASANSCLKCRDFSAADSHATKFPRQNVPSLDWLSSQLTDPFPTLTDKARAIFTWLHHNIDYNVVAFFNNAVKPSTPLSTLDTGLAVCEGFAALFAALATKAGLEAIVISGHGKGFGYKPIGPGDPIPAEMSGHAWNAVKLDDGVWKLIDPCWGAGNCSGKGQPYNKAFAPNHFSKDNDEFGLSHFPTNRAHQFRLDGRIVEWEEYFVGDRSGPPVLVYNDIPPKEGLSEYKFEPKGLRLPVSPSAHGGPTVRFQFQKVCPHWDPVRNAGKPFVYVLATGIGADGRAKEYIPFETNIDAGGMFWWADVPPGKLGAPGERVSVYTVNEINGMSGRGLNKEEYLLKKGRSAMAFGGVCAWELV